MYKCVIFDLDGTLLDTLDDLANAGNYALSVQGFDVHPIEKYKYFVGNGIPKLIERILPENTDQEAFKKTYETFCSYYKIHMNDCTHPYSGILEMLKKLKECAIKLFIVTNKSDSFAKEIVKRYFGDLIDEVYGGIEGLPKKPDPYMVNKAICHSGIKKEEILYVGDSDVDMQAAKNAGLKSCGVLWGFRERNELEAAGAVLICSNCSELSRLILE